MTDIMKLADDYAAKNRAVANVIEQGTSGELIEADGDKKRARAALKSAIEALQEENALLEGTLESRGRNIAALQAENEQFRLLAKANSEALGAALVERDALQAKLDAMGKGEPVAYSVGNTLKWHEGKGMTNAQLCAAPQALAPEPLTDERITEIARYWSNSSFASSATRFCTDFARAIESAHGIGATP